MGTNTGTIMTLANSIIGVSVLAMPFCFKQCGIALSILMLIASSLLSRLACHFLLKSAVMARRRTFEFLAFHTFGLTGKFTVELFIIGFLMGTCIAFFVVMGDLGPAIVAKIMGLSNTAALRPSVLIGLAVFVVLPLGMLRNVDSLSSVSMATIGFYICLVLKVVGESLPHLLAGDWYEQVYFWRPAGILQCIPIFSMALFCQTQLFEIYETMHNASLDRMNFVIRAACNICTGVYICVGFFGYIAFCTQPFTGNVLMSFTPSIVSEMIKLGFVLSVAVSFPLVIFPCRASLYSLLFRRNNDVLLFLPKRDVPSSVKTPAEPESWLLPVKTSHILPSGKCFSTITMPHHEGVGSHIPEARFKCLTVFIICVALVIGLLIPNIELVLGLVGSTIGVLICVMFPAAAFICMSTKSNSDRMLAQVLLFVGALILVLGTYATLNSAYDAKPAVELRIDELAPISVEKVPHFHEKIDNSLADIPPKLEQKPELNVKQTVEEHMEPAVVAADVKAPPPESKGTRVDVSKADKRQEPPVPVEPVGNVVQEPTLVSLVKGEKSDIKETVKKEEKIHDDAEPKKTAQSDSEKLEIKPAGGEQVHQDAIKKEEEELAEAEKQGNALGDSKNEEILRKLEKHEAQQMKILQEQKQILQALQEHQERELLKEQQENAEKKLIEDKNAKALIEKQVEKLLPISQVKEESKEVRPIIAKSLEKEVPFPQKKKQDLLQQIANGELKKPIVLSPPKEKISLEKQRQPSQKSVKSSLADDSLGSNVPAAEIKESLNVAAPNVKVESEFGAAPAQPLFLERLKSPPLPLAIHNKTQSIISQSKVINEKLPLKPANEINAMRREILQEPVDSTQVPISEVDVKNASLGMKENLNSVDSAKLLHDREKRDVDSSEKMNVISDSRNVLENLAHHNMSNEGNVALEEENCHVTEESINSNLIHGKEMYKQHNTIVNAGGGIIIPANQEKVNPLKHTENSMVLPSAGSEIVKIEENVKSPQVVLNSSKEDKNKLIEEPALDATNHSKELKSMPQAQDISIDAVMIKSGIHLSNPQIKSKEGDEVTILRQAVSPDAKPMKRDLKSISVTEEKLSPRKQG